MADGCGVARWHGTVVFLRNRTDKYGSKPFLWVVLGMWVVAIFCGCCWPAGWPASAAPLVAGALLVIGGVSAATYDLSITRLLMNTVSDKPGNAQFFALNAAIVNIVAASMPVVWGALLDAWKGVDVTLGTLRCESLHAVLRRRGIAVGAGGDCAQARARRARLF